MGNAALLTANIAEQLAQLVGQRVRAGTSAAYDLGTLVRIDDRLAAFQDALCVHRNEGWNAAVQLVEEGPGPETLFGVFTAAFDQPDEETLNKSLQLWQAVDEALDSEESPGTSPVPIDIVARAIAYAAPPDSFDEKLASSVEPRSGILRTLMHLARQDEPNLLPEFVTLFAADTSVNGAIDTPERLEHLPVSMLELRRDAILTILGVFDRGGQMFEVVRAPGLLGDHAAVLWPLLTPSDQVRLTLRTLREEPPMRRRLIQLIGAFGDPAFIPWLIEQMGEPIHARVAGEAVSMITGWDLAYDDLETDAPDGFDAGPTDDPDDPNVEMDADDDLPWPDQELVADRWHKECARFDEGQRYLGGFPRDACAPVLRHGKQRQRIVAAYELAKGGEPLFPYDAPARVQMKLLDQMGL